MERGQLVMLLDALGYRVDPETRVISMTLLTRPSLLD